MSEHDNLNGQLVAVAATKERQLEESDEGEIEKREGHGPVLSDQAISERPDHESSDDILGTHTVTRSSTFLVDTPCT